MFRCNHHHQGAHCVSLLKLQLLILHGLLNHIASFVFSNLLYVVIDDVSVMAAYFDLLCVCIVHRAEGQYPSARHNRPKYAAITPTTLILVHWYQTCNFS